MSLDRKILEELKRFNQINTYILNEQPAPPPPPVDSAAAPGSEAPIGEPEGGMPPPDAAEHLTRQEHTGRWGCYFRTNSI
jgi:hypothetical protein